MRGVHLDKEHSPAPAWRRLLAAAIAATACWFVVVRLLELEHDVAQQAFCLAVMVCTAVLSGVAAGRPAFGVLVASLLLGVIWLASSLKVAYLREALLAPDLRYLAATFSSEVIAHYPGMLRKSLIALLGGGALATLLWRLESPGLWRARRRRRRLGMTLLASLPLAACLWPRGPFTDVYAVPTWEFISNGARNPITTFISSFSRMELVLPVRSSGGDRAQWQLPAAVAPQATGNAPDIVAVLEESTLDPRQWAACTSPRCRFDLFEPDAATRGYGDLRVHTWGGATWTSEFAFFAGLPHTVFGAAGIYAPYNIVPRLAYSLPRQLKALGYRTIAIYPMGKEFVGAATAYRDYGFDEFHDASELGLHWESTDSDLMQHVQALYAARRGTATGPLFVMVPTMRQHGPHDYPLARLPPPWNEPPAPQLDERANRNLGTYLYRMHQSDLALSQLRQFLFASGNPVLLVHFGDHQPSFDGLEQTLRRARVAASPAAALYDTYYRIDTNFPAAPWSPPDELDLAFLGGVVLQQAGLPLDDYFQANAVLRERCRGLFDACPAPVLADYFGHVFDALHLLQ